MERAPAGWHVDPRRPTSDRGPAPEAYESPADVLLRFQSTAGNHAVQRLIAGGGSPLQRMTIGTTPYTPYGQTTRPLWDRLRGALQYNGLSPHGGRRVFLDVVRSQQTFASEGVFMAHMVELAKAELKRVEDARQGGDKKARGWTRRLKLARPQWGADQAHASGTEIRHVVRNALLRNTLKAEFDLLKQRTTTDGELLELMWTNFRPVSDKLGLARPATSWDLLNGLYRGLYLHKKNLFTGAGGVNEVIGLAADQVEKVARQLSSANGTAPPDDVKRAIQLVWDAAADAERTALAKVSKMSNQTAARFKLGLDDFFQNLDDFLGDLEDEWLQTPPEYKTMSDEILDIADNFSFDLILEESGISAAEIKKRQEVSVYVDTRLNGHQAGNPAALAAVFVQFLS